ncbi:MAG: 30S ribosomal protein S17 [Candidatus Kerfeldbacteria bacterium RIFOXYA2_FULL_38_24]|uniref:Small ribosomal subunit protein uS17 n=1 Tax=Candidatus Kerfeldbacteria bacterium RIFOXYB2_FULL_38_14 TaxID=1798547 RepID=A0A1G2BF05_9BACT|nr:MAG: 30S ribosomal protein S17 [Candidatus Kerfeldbacteria bacterium RIFOXYB2_FULL_38_14]OGY87934.1 MAG: 30S ribosomal protein S17 [Candidatus Kerfeldbacteria bacterium RIFOXYA2_FULL_38_24]OGY88654.1 MAG: 30S ribosomal protein S17 [Candidatus Kerfeldbacteria bacterium RIFOXYC2_FULL_38_9]
MSETPKNKTIIKHARVLAGKVVSKKNDQTIVVARETKARHKLYNKLYHKTKKFHVHDPKNQYQENDLVEFTACRPMSKLKRWRVVYKTKEIS